MSPDQLCPEVSVQWRDRKWIMRRPKIATERLFRKYLERKAVGSVVGNAEVFAALGELGLSVAIKAVSQECVAGVYAWQREGWAKAMADGENLAYLFWLILHQEPDQRLLALERTSETPKLVLCMDEFFRERRQELIVKYNLLMADTPRAREEAAAELAMFEAEQVAATAPGVVGGDAGGSGADRPTAAA